MSDEENKTRATTGVKFSAFKQVGPQEGNPVEVVGLRDGENVRASLTTDLIETNPGITFRNAKGQFASPDPGVMELTNQLKVNRYLYDRMLESGVTIDAAPPDTYADGTFWFCNSQDSMQLFVFHEDSDAWIPVAPPATISDRVAAGEETQGALVEAVGELESKVTALEGVVGEHSLIFNPNNANPRAGDFNIKNGANQVVNNLSDAKFIFISEEDRNGGSIAVDRIIEGDVMRLSDIGGVTAELKIIAAVGAGLFEIEKLFGGLDRLSELPYDFNLFSSFDPQGLATIDYVDERDGTKLNLSGGKMEGSLDMGDQSIVNLPEPNGDTSPATKKYVDEKTKEAGGGKPPRPYAQPVQLVLWRYTEKSKEELSSNEFSIKITGEAIEVFLSPHIHGSFYVPGKTINYSHVIGEAYATINEHDGSNVLGFKGNKWWFIQKTTTNGSTKYHNALSGIYYKPGLDAHPLVVGRYYALNFPSPFPFF